MAEKLTGHWSGFMLDAEGHRARLELDLKEDKGALKGALTFGLVEEHEITERQGEVSGKVSDDKVHLYYTVKNEAEALEVDFEGEMLALKHHAKAAMYGIYRVRGEGKQTLSGGVAILYFYATPE